jgi:hypothetical protein
MPRVQRREDDIVERMQPNAAEAVPESRPRRVKRERRDLV